jgi:hypothetical protein
MQSWHAVALVFGQVLIGATFAASALGKVRDPDGFAQSAGAFRLIPADRVPIVARLLTVADVLVVALLVVGLVPAAGVATTAGLGIAVALLVAYTVGLIAVRVRGMTVTCHCFGASPAPVSWWDVVRNVVLVGGAGWGMAAGSPESRLPVGDGILVAMVALAAALILTNLSNVMNTAVHVAGAE